MAAFEPHAYLINIFASIFLATAQVIYIVRLIRRKVTPSVITWLGWAVLVAVSFVSQISEYGWNWVLMGHLFSGLGCTMIFVFSFFSKQYVIHPKDWSYLWLGMVCIVLYVLTKDPWLTTLFSILADAILGLPTILKAIKNPITEKNLGWNLAMGCWVLTVFTGINKDPIFLLFPIYCFLFNAVMSYLTTDRRILLKSGGVKQLGLK